MIDINIRGVFVATHAALKHMKSGGRIISIGSAVGERVAAPGLVPYAGTKGAVKMFTQALAREIGSRGITVNNVQPGPIDTELNPATGDWAVPQKAATALNRYGKVDEIAAMVAFVAGPEASYITGANLTVDGGMNAQLDRECATRTKVYEHKSCSHYRRPTSGIGRATALAFANDGARLAVSGRQRRGRLPNWSRNSGNQAEAEYVHADVRIEDDVRNLVDQTIKRFGRFGCGCQHCRNRRKTGSPR